MGYCGSVSTRSSSNSSCFIATATYGSEYEKEVVLFRLYRDIVLNKSYLGKKLITLYYKISPPIAKMISKNSLLKRYSLKLLSRMLNRIKRDSRLQKKPSQITIQYNSACNLKCKLCFVSPDEVAENKRINQIKLFDFLKRYNNYQTIDWIIWTGDGELFLEDEFFDSINKICEDYPNIIHTLITNGTIDKLNKLRYPEQIYLNVSLDGIKEIHEDNRGEGSFDKTINFLQHASKINFKKVTCRLIATKKSLINIDDYVKLVKDIDKGFAIYIQDLIDPCKTNVNIEDYYIGFDEIEKVAKIDNSIVLQKKNPIFKEISLHHNGIYNCFQAVTKIGDYDSNIKDIIANYNKSFLNCKKCRSSCK